MQGYSLCREHCALMTSSGSVEGLPRRCVLRPSRVVVCKLGCTLELLGAFKNHQLQGSTESKWGYWAPGEL